jgi:hypothetical protein
MSSPLSPPAPPRCVVCWLLTWFAAVNSVIIVAAAALDCLWLPLQPKLIASRWTTGSNRCRRQHLPLLPGDRSEGRDMQQRSLDCVRWWDGGLRRRWLDVAAGRAAMASSAGGDKKGGQLRFRRVFPEQNRWQSHAIADYGDVTACNTMCSMQWHCHNWRLDRTGMGIVG